MLITKPFDLMDIPKASEQTTAWGLPGLGFGNDLRPCIDGSLRGGGAISASESITDPALPNGRGCQRKEEFDENGSDFDWCRKTHSEIHGVYMYDSMCFSHRHSQPIQSK